MMTDKEINEMIRTSALAIHMEEEIAKIMEKYDFDDDGTITEKENDPKSNNKKMKKNKRKKNHLPYRFLLYKRRAYIKPCIFLV